VTPDLRPIDEIRFENLKRVNPRTAQSVMETRVGRPIDQKILDEDMRRLYGTGDFEHVSYRFLEEPGRRVLAVNAVEKSWGPNYLRFGLGLTTDFTGDAYFNVLASYRMTWLNSLGAEWRTDLQVGRTSNLATEFYQPVNAQGALFVAPHATVERRASDLYQDDNRIARYDMISRLAGVDVGAQFSQYGELRLGILGGTLRPNLDSGPEFLSPGETNISQGAFRLRLILDQIDSVHFPRSGWRGTLRVFDSNDILGADHTYTKWDADAQAAYSFGDHTLNFSVVAGGTIGSDPLPRHDLFQWGGFLQQSGYATGQLLGEDLKFARLMYYHRILRGTLLEGAYGGASLEYGKVGKPLVPGNPDDWLESASIFIAADTPIGPAYFGYGRARDGNDNFYFYLGRPF